MNVEEEQRLKARYCEESELKLNEYQNKVELLMKQNEELKFGNKIAEENALSEISTLNEQKKLLVKEVKASRKRIEGLSEAASASQSERVSLSSRLETANAMSEELSLKLREQDVKHAQTCVALQSVYEGMKRRYTKTVHLDLCIYCSFVWCYRQACSVGRKLSAESEPITQGFGVGLGA